MTPAARLAAAIECLDLIVTATRDGGAAADTVIARYFAARRYAGSKDRRAVRDLVFDVIRSVGERPASGRAAMIAYARAADPDLLTLFGSGGHGPSALGDGDSSGAMLTSVPAWLSERLTARFGSDAGPEVAALLARAPLDLRVNRLKATREDIHLSGAVPTPFARDGLRLTTASDVAALPEFGAGLIEVQDEGSQLAVAACSAKPGMTVIDLCAGAGGKTLGLAAAMANRGRLVATDTDRGRLQRMTPRLIRAGVTIAESRLLDPRREAAALADLAGSADVVLVDAPCSGTGTWRRNPDARWRLTPDRLANLCTTQARLLDFAVPLVRIGGALVYVACSLLPEEGEVQVDAFLNRHSGFTPDAVAVGPTPATTVMVLTPYRHGCDGFVIARMARLC